MKQWTLKEPKPMGDNDPKYGQTYWSYTYDSDMPLMFNLMDGAVGDGTVVTAEEWVNKESAKGTEYLRLRKVKVVSGGDSSPKSRQTSSVSLTNDTSKLNELIYDDTQEILRILNQTVPPQSLKEQWDKTTGKEDTVVDVDPEEEISLDQIPF